MDHKYVYLFSEGNANMRELLGGKGANLAEMTNIGLPVPQVIGPQFHHLGILVSGAARPSKM